MQPRAAGSASFVGSCAGHAALRRFFLGCALGACGLSVGWPRAGAAQSVSPPSPAAAPAAPTSSGSIPADLRRDEIRCDEAGCALGGCVVNDLLAPSGSALRSVRVVPHVVDGTPRGFRLLGLRPGSLPARMGLQNGDHVLAVNGHDLGSPERALMAYSSTQASGTALVALERSGQPLSRRFTLDRRPLLPGECPESTPAPTPPPATASVAPTPAGPSDTLRAVAKDLRCKADRCTLRRSTIDRILADSASWSRSARLIPVLRSEDKQDNQIRGLKVFGIRGGSLLALLGLRNGDVVRSINGHDVSSPDRALAAYAALRDSDELRVAIERAGAAQTLTYKILP